MPDGEITPPGQEPTTPTTPAGEGSNRGIDGFPEEAQDYIRRLREENAKHRNDRKTVEQKLKEYEDRDKSESQKLVERAEVAERVASESATRLLRYEVAASKGIPLNLAGRLQGSTKEELEADADKLAQDFGLTPGEPGSGGSGFDGGVRRPVQKAKTMNGAIREMAGL